MQAQTQFFLEPWLLAIALLDQQLSESIVHHLKYPVSSTIFFKNCFVHYLKFKVFVIYIFSTNITEIIHIEFKKY